MIQVIVILGLMCFLWIVAMYATYHEEQDDARETPHRNEKAA